MRQIKFRAWNGKSMITPTAIINGKAAINKPCDIKDRVLTDEDGVNYYCNWDIDKTTDYPLMQFTGLTDMNGVENYEGDVIQYWELYECHSDAVDYFDVEPQNNFSVDEVFFELKTGVVELVDGAFKVNGTYIFDIAEHNKNRIIDNHYQGSLGLPLKDFIYDCYERGITKPLSKGLGAIKIIGNCHQHPELLEQ